MLRKLFSLVVVLLGALLITGIAEAQTACNPPDGTRALLRAQIGFNDHQVVVCSGDVCKGRLVNAQGFLVPCPAVPEPIVCAERTRWEEWGACHSMPPGHTTTPERHKLGGGVPGDFKLILDGRGRGVRGYRCDAALRDWKPEPPEHCNVPSEPSVPPPAKPRSPGGDAKAGPGSIKPKPKAKD